MNKIALINRVKYNKTIYLIYNYFGSKVISFLKHFLHTDDKLIVFASFGGRKFDDSPKAIYDAMLKDERFEECHFVWAFIHPEGYNLPKGEKVRIDTFRYYKILLRARIWVTNSSMTRGLNLTGINTFELNTWHGSAVKKMGADVNKNSKAFGLKEQKENEGVMLAQGKYDVDVFSRAFNHPQDFFRIIGLPRNDVLAHTTPEEREKIRNKMELPKGKKIILYAPTYREFEKDTNYNCILEIPIDLKKWEEQLGHDYILLLRAHYEVVKMMNFKDNDFVRNVSSYPNLNELMIVSDILISDYSSIYFDYSIMGKPMLSFAYDYERYYRERGLYFDIRKELESEGLECEDCVISELLQMDIEKRRNIALRFRDKYVEEYGNASKRSLDIIKQQLKD